MAGVMQFGALIIVLIDVIVHAKLITEWHFITWFTLLGYILSLFGFIVTCLLPNSFIMPLFLTSITDGQNLFWIFYDLFSCGSVWFLIILIVVTAILPDIIIKIIENLRVSIFLFKENNEKKMKRKSMISHQHRVGEANPSKLNHAFDSGNEAFLDKDAENVERKNDSENKIEDIDKNKNQKYYKTVLTEMDGDILFNTLV